MAHSTDLKDITQHKGMDNSVLKKVLAHMVLASGKEPYLSRHRCLGAAHMLFCGFIAASGLLIACFSLHRCLAAAHTALRIPAAKWLLVKESLPCGSGRRVQAA